MSAYDEYLSSDFSCELEVYKGQPKIVIKRNGEDLNLPYRNTLGFMASRALVLREPKTIQIMQRFLDSDGEVPAQGTSQTFDTKYLLRSENKPYRGKSVLRVSGRSPNGTSTGLNGGRLLIHAYVEAFECIMDKLDSIYGKE